MRHAPRHNLARFLILALALALALPGPAWAKEVTPEKEKELGQRFHLKVAASGLLLDDPIVNQYYRSVTDRIMRGAGLKPGQYQFFIVRRGGINAFAVPGGYVYMHTGTVTSLENEGQLASVLGHEVAHIASRHFARRVESASALSMGYLAAMLAGASVQAMLANSRDDEAEADAKGAQYIAKAGYNPRDMYGAFKIMADRSFQVSSDIPTYMSTHPALTSRLATTFQAYAGAPPSPPDEAYRAFSDRVLALSGEPRQVRAVLGKRLAANGDDHSALHALGLLLAREQNLAKADEFMRRALALAPGNREYLADLGDLSLKRRQTKEAKAFYEKAGGANRQAVLGLARAAELLGDEKTAGAQYAKAVAMDREPYPEALELAGRFFGQSGRLGQGHYYTGLYFVATGNVDKAIFHLKQVAAQPDSAPFRAQADKKLKEMEEIKQKDDKAKGRGK